MKTEKPRVETWPRPRLRAGDIIQLHQEGQCEVLSVTESRAVVRPTTRKTREVKTIEAGESVTIAKFQAPSNTFNISANSDCPIVSRL